MARAAAVPKQFGKGCFVEPTIFYDVDNNARIAQEEIFGPVACVIPFDDEAHALAYRERHALRPRRGRLDARHFQGFRVVKQIRAGIVWVNHMQPTYIEAPVGRLQAVGLRP